MRVAMQEGGGKWSLKFNSATLNGNKRPGHGNEGLGAKRALEAADYETVATTGSGSIQAGSKSYNIV